jgi:hypothetical protein
LLFANNRIKERGRGLLGWPNGKNMGKRQKRDKAMEGIRNGRNRLTNMLKEITLH